MSLSSPHCVTYKSLVISWQRQQRLISCSRFNLSPTILFSCAIMSVLADSQGDRLVCRVSIQRTSTPKPPTFTGREFFTAELAQTRHLLRHHLHSRHCYRADLCSVLARHSFPTSDHLLLIADLSPKAAGSWRQAERFRVLNQCIPRVSIPRPRPMCSRSALRQQQLTVKLLHWSPCQSTDTCG